MILVSDFITQNLEIRVISFNFIMFKSVNNEYVGFMMINDKKKVEYAAERTT